jgi:hypothetical protein
MFFLSLYAANRFVDALEAAIKAKLSRLDAGAFPALRARAVGRLEIAAAHGGLYSGVSPKRPGVIYGYSFSNVSFESLAPNR